jgi:hypothetical protein
MLQLSYISFVSLHHLLDLFKLSLLRSSHPWLLPPFSSHNRRCCCGQWIRRGCLVSLVAREHQLFDIACLFIKHVKSDSFCNRSLCLLVQVFLLSHLDTHRCYFSVHLPKLLLQGSLSGNEFRLLGKESFHLGEFEIDWIDKLIELLLACWFSLDQSSNRCQNRLVAVLLVW